MTATRADRIWTGAQGRLVNCGAILESFSGLIVVRPAQPARLRVERDFLPFVEDFGLKIAQSEIGLRAPKVHAAASSARVSIRRRIQFPHSRRRPPRAEGRPAALGTPHPRKCNTIDMFGFQNPVTKMDHSTWACVLAPSRNAVHARKLWMNA